MASNDLDKIKRNVAKMVSMNAPEEDIDRYIASEGVTLDAIRNHPSPPEWEQMKAAISSMENAASADVGQRMTESQGPSWQGVKQAAKDVGPYLPATAATITSLALAPETAGMSLGPLLLNTVPKVAAAGGAGKILDYILNPERAPKTMGGKALGVVKEGVSQGGYEFVGGIGYKGLSYLMRPVAEGIGITGRAIKSAPELEKGAANAIDTMQRIQGPVKPTLKEAIVGQEPYRMVLSAGQASTNRIVDLMENAADVGLFGGKMAQFKRGQQEMGEEVINRFAAGLRNTDMTAEEIGDFVVSQIKGEKSAFHAAARGKYRQLDAITNEAVVDMVPITKFLTNINNERVAKGIGGSETGQKIISGILQDELIQDGRIGFMQANDLKSRIMKEAEAAIAANRRDPAAGLASKLAQMIDRQMNDAATKLPPEAMGYWRELRQWYKEGAAPFNKKLIKRLMNTDEALSEDVVEKLLRPSTARRELEYVRGLVGNKTFEDMSGAWLQREIMKATKDNKVVGKDLSNIIKQMSMNGNIDLMFSPEKKKALNGIVDFLKLSQAKPGGPGRLAVQITQAGAAIGLATGAYFTGDTKKGAAGALLILVGPGVAARIMTRPQVVRMLIAGAKMPKGSPQLATLVVRLNSEIKKLEKEEADANKPKSFNMLDAIDKTYRKAMGQ